MIDRRRSDGGIGTLEQEYGSGSWLWRPQTYTYLERDRCQVGIFHDEIRVWRLGEDLNVKYSLAARLVSGLSGPARMTCISMDADQLHPPPGDGLVATADERRIIAGLDNVMSVLQSSPCVKKLAAGNNELLHAFFP